MEREKKNFTIILHLSVSLDVQFEYIERYIHKKNDRSYMHSLFIVFILFYVNSATFGLKKWN